MQRASHHGNVYDLAAEEVLATVSHELLTPLTSIRSGAQTLTRGDITLDSDTRQHLLELLEEQSERLEYVIKQVLNASRLDVGDINPTIGEFDARPVIGSAIDDAVARLALPVDLHWHHHNFSRGICGDPALLYDVLTRLIENACRYAGGTPHVQIDCEHHGDRVVIVVRDAGVGIANWQQSKIFDRFYRAVPDMTDGVSGGLGLGLYICRRMMSLMGGHIWCESQPQQGAAFFLDFPAAAGLALHPNLGSHDELRREIA